MNGRETEIGGDGRGFPSTSLTLVERFRTEDPQARRRHLEALVERYWKPVYWVLRSSWSKSNEDAKDLTQEFFLRVVLEGSVTQGFDPGKGSFRSFLKGALSNFMLNATRDASAQKRGGLAHIVRLDALEGHGPGLPAGDPSESPEQRFDRAWKEEILGRALRHLEERLRAQGRESVFRIFCRYDLETTPGGTSYEDLAAEFGMSASMVKHALSFAREEYRRAVTEQVGQDASTPEELARELRDLFSS